MPTVWCEGALYSHSTTKAANMSRVVNMKVACYASMKSWTIATIMGRAMEKLAELMLIAPKLPSPTKKYEESEDQEVPDPDNDRSTMMTQVLIKKTQKKILCW